MKQSLIVTIGEVLWDMFPDGTCFGGAPGNLACHAAMLGAEAIVLSGVGQDKLGDEALAHLRERGVNADYMAQISDFPTGTVQVSLDAAGKPKFDICRDVAWDNIPWTDALIDLAGRADAVVFGTLGQRGAVSRATTRRLLEHMPERVLRILDINLRPPDYDDAVILESLELANALKLSDDEIGEVAKVCGLSGSHSEIVEGLKQRFGLRLVVMTRGSKGALLFDENRCSETEGIAVTVKDTVGAGDSFTAVTVVGYLRGLDLDTINRHACRVAAYVCSKSGATPALPDQLREFS